jgi:hypothetical protein
MYLPLLILVLFCHIILDVDLIDLGVFMENDTN